MDSCSFCGKARREVRKLIAGPDVHICNECIDLCNDVILGEAEEIAETQDRDEQLYEFETRDLGDDMRAAGTSVFIYPRARRETRMTGWDHETIAARLAAALRTGAARQRDAAAQVEKLADAVLANDAAEIERRLARFSGLERLEVSHDVGKALDVIRFLWPAAPE